MGGRPRGAHFAIGKLVQRQDVYKDEAVPSAFSATLKLGRHIDAMATNEDSPLFQTLKAAVEKAYGGGKLHVYGTHLTGEEVIVGSEQCRPVTDLVLEDSRQRKIIVEIKAAKKLPSKKINTAIDKMKNHTGLKAPFHFLRDSKLSRAFLQLGIQLKSFESGTKGFIAVVDKKQVQVLKPRPREFHKILGIIKKT